MALRADYSTETEKTYRIAKHKANSGDPNINKELFEEIFRISRASFTPVISKEEVTNLIKDSALLIVAYDKDKMQPVGFASSHYTDDFCYLSSAAIIKSEQGKGLYQMFNRLRISDGLSKGFDTFTVTTQNPRVENGISCTFDALLMEGRISGYSMQREVIRGCYGRLITGYIPRSSEERINRLFSMLDYTRGDAFQISFVASRTRKFFWE
jgi:hypothetical protein